MSFIDGFVAPVPTANKETYRDYARKASELFKEFGALRVVECWGNDVRKGKTTDFQGSVKLEDGETVVFAWIEWPSKEVRDAGHQKMMSDPRMEALGETPFDGKRMIYGGFDAILDTGEA